MAIRTLMSQLQTVAPVRQQLEDQITELATRLPSHVMTLPGANALRAMSLFGETDPVQTFRSADELVAFAGLDLTVYQTGQYDASNPVDHGLPDHPSRKRAAHLLPSQTSCRPAPLGRGNRRSLQAVPHQLADPDGPT